MDLLQLQNLCKRDSESSQEEFLLQHRHYQTQLQLFKLKPSKEAREFESLINFLSHVAPVYKKELADFPQQLITLLDENASALEPGLRRTLAKALILMRNKDLIAPTTLLCLFFKLFRCKDKPLRQMLYSHIVSDIKNINEKHKNQKLNRTLQNFMYTMLNDPSDVAAKKSLDVMIDLYRKRIWNDSKTVNVISQGCFSKFSKIKVDAIQFFLSAESTEQEEEEETPTVQDMIKKYSTHAAKTKKRQKKLQRGIKKAQKLQNKEKVVKVNFPAIELLNDPQGFAEKLLANLKNSTERFEVKVMMMNLISRLIGCHKLLLLNFYTWVQRYLKPQQQNVAQILAIVAQSSHDLVPPENLEEVVRVIANHFVNEHGAPEATAVGLNAIREICTRQPLAISDKELLRELTSYKKNHDKGIMMASRSIIALYRNVNPGLLHKHDRGKFADMSTEPQQYGELRPAEKVKDVELLEENEGENKDGEDSDGWVNVSDNESEFIDIPDSSDSDDEEGDGEDVWVETDDDGSEDEGEGDEVEEDDQEGAEEDDEEEDEENSEGEQKADEDEASWFIDKAPAGNTTENPTPAPTGPDSMETAPSGAEPEKNGKSSRPDLDRLLTPEDFERMKRKRQQREEQEDNSDEDEARPDYEVDPASIIGFQKKRKLDKEGRLASVLAGREGRDKFGRRKEKMGTSHTNKDTAKAQPYQLTRHSAAVRAKAKVSLKEKVQQRKKKKGGRKGGKKRK